MDGARPEHAKSGLSLVHLVRASNGPEPLRAFAAALRRHAPGVDCGLVIAMKGFERRGEAQPYLDEIADLNPEPLFFPDAGLDLGVYFAAAERLGSERYCFLNSYATPLVDEWLAKLDAALAEPRVGLVGATGSWESTRSWIAYSLRLPSAYRGALPPARIVRRRLLELVPERAAGRPRSMRESLRLRAMTLRLLSEHERFPAYHVRTNAFMISHATLARLRTSTIRSQRDTLVLESGRNSLTRQVQRMGMRTLVVDRGGRAFDHRHWDQSNTFWQGDQEGLLVADNRTSLYERGDPDLRHVLASLTWGRRARPAAPRERMDTVVT